MASQPWHSSSDRCKIRVVLFERLKEDRGRCFLKSALAVAAAKRGASPWGIVKRDVFLPWGQAEDACGSPGRGRRFCKVRSRPEFCNTNVAREDQGKRIHINRNGNPHCAGHTSSNQGTGLFLAPSMRRHQQWEG